MAFEALLSEKNEDGFQLICTERHAPLPGKTKIRDTLSGKQRGTILIGPEGGWTPSERHQAKTAGFSPISLGEHILRTETAALAILSILQYEINLWKS